MKSHQNDLGVCEVCGERFQRWRGERRRHFENRWWCSENCRGSGSCCRETAWTRIPGTTEKMPVYMTQAEVGELFGVTGQMIDHIERQALKKIVNAMREI